MIVHFPLLLFGLLLLWFPRQWMRLGMGVGPKRRKVIAGTVAASTWSKADAGNPRVTFRREFSKVRNYFDLLRGAAGSLAIIGSPQIQPSLAVSDAEGAT